MGRTTTIDEARASRRAPIHERERSVALAVVDRQGRCVLSNDALDALLGPDVLDADRTFLPGVARALDLDALLLRGFAGESVEPITCSLTLDEDDARHLTLSVSSSPIRDADDVVSHVSVMLRDDTGALCTREAATATDTRDRERRAGVIASLSHELRTPLNAIIGFAAILHDGQVSADSPMHTEFLGDILTSGRRLLELVDDALDLAKLESGAIDFRPEQASITRVINEACLSLREISGEQDVRVEVHRDPALETIVIDVGRFRQIVHNILASSLGFTPSGGHVRIVTRIIDDERFALEIGDDGLGLAASDLDELFTPFNRLGMTADSTRRSAGLGLALVKRIVEALGGTVSATSMPGVGTTFYVILPRSSERTEPAR